MEVGKWPAKGRIRFFGGIATTSMLGIGSSSHQQGGDGEKAKQHRGALRKWANKVMTSNTNLFLFSCEIV